MQRTKRVLNKNWHASPLKARWRIYIYIYIYTCMLHVWYMYGTSTSYVIRHTSYVLRPTSYVLRPTENHWAPLCYLASGGSKISKKDVPGENYWAPLCYLASCRSKISNKRRPWRTKLAYIGHVCIYIYIYIYIIQDTCDMIA